MDEFHYAWPFLIPIVGIICTFAFVIVLEPLSGLIPGYARRAAVTLSACRGAVGIALCACSPSLNRLTEWVSAAALFIWWSTAKLRRMTSLSTGKSVNLRLCLPG